MGWNEGYTIFEQTVIGAYDVGVLNKDLLEVLCAPYRRTDIDSGGMRDLKTKDGKGVEQVVIETFGLDYPVYPDCSDDDWATIDEWADKVAALFNQATRWRNA